MRRRRRRAWALAGCLVAVLSVCLGVFFDFAQGSTCWSCHSSNASRRIQYEPKFLFFSHGSKLWHCRNCGLVWELGKPWLTITYENPYPTNLMGTSHDLELNAVAGETPRAEAVKAPKSLSVKQQ